MGTVPRNNAIVHALRLHTQNSPEGNVPGIGYNPGGGGTASLKVAKQPHLLFGIVRPSIFYYCPLFFRVIDCRAPTKLSTNVIQSLLNGFLNKECHVSNTIEGKYKH